MKTNATLIGKAAQWLDSFSFIGTAFLIRGKSTLDNSNTEYVVMCNTKAVTNQIQKVPYQDFIAYDQPMLFIQMDNMISKEGATVITDRILYELAYCTPVDDATFNSYMKKYLDVDYHDIFNHTKRAEFNRLISGIEFPYHCLRWIEETLDLIYAQGLTYDFMLETKVYPIYQDIFSKGFLMDVEAMKNEYYMIENENNVMYEYLIDHGCYNLNSDVSSMYDSLDTDGIKVLKRYQKNQLLLKKYPLKKLVRTENKKVRPYLKCSYKQIGAKTLRISTSKINIYGLPKRLRQHLIPNDGKLFVEADYHASQLLILAKLAHENWLIEAYEQGQDIYNMFAKSFFNKSLENIKPNERKAMKKIFFTYVNGARVTTLHKILTSLDIHMSVEQMKISLQRLRDSNSKIETYLKSLRYKSNVMVPTGRCWSEEYLPKSKKRASNIIQIVEAEILFNAVIMVNEAVSQYEGMRIYLTMHDSITIEAPINCVAEAESILKNSLTKAVQLFFDMTNVHINIAVKPHGKEKENYIMKTNNIKNPMRNQIDIVTLKNLKSQIKEQKKKVTRPVSPVPEQEYLAFVKDEIYDEENNIVKVDFVVFVGDKTSTFKAKFNMSTNASFYYKSMVNLLADEDEDIIGKLCYVVFHQNEQYINIEVISAASEEELGIDLADEVEEEVQITKASKPTVSLNKAKSLLEEDEFEDEDIEDEEDEE